MRLQPHQIAVLSLAAFWAGLILALMLVHAHTQAPEYAPFQTPF